MRIPFDGLTDLQDILHIVFADLPLEHSLDGMHSKDPWTNAHDSLQLKIS